MAGLHDHGDTFIQNETAKLPMVAQGIPQAQTSHQDMVCKGTLGHQLTKCSYKNYS